jgi:hypothetical protein
MARSICAAGIGLVVVSLLLASCASAPRTMVTTSSLPALKGTWEGWTDFGIGQGKPVLTQVTIVNDTVPITTKITLFNLPSEVARVFPAEAKTAGNDVTFEFTGGKITNQGTLIAQSGKDILEITYFAGKKPKIQGWFYYWVTKGTFETYKK